MADKDPVMEVLTTIGEAINGIWADISVLSDNQKFLLKRLNEIDAGMRDGEYDPAFPIDPDEWSRLQLDIADIERRTRSLAALNLPD